MIENATTAPGGKTPPIFFVVLDLFPKSEGNGISVLSEGTWIGIEGFD